MVFVEPDNLLKLVHNMCRMPAGYPLIPMAGERCVTGMRLSSVYYISGQHDTEMTCGMYFPLFKKYVSDGRYGL
jgi:hypothetical protein